jgi:hypothetical protein
VCGDGVSVSRGGAVVVGKGGSNWEESDVRVLMEV